MSQNRTFLRWESAFDPVQSDQLTIYVGDVIHPLVSTIAVA